MAPKSKTADQQLLQNILETSPVGIVVTDAAGQITFANREAEKILGLEKATITSRGYNDPLWKITDYDGNPFPDEKLPFAIVQKTLQPVYDVRHATEYPGGRSDSQSK